MEVKEAIERIKEHNRIHFSKEYPRAVKITDALDMAIEACEKQVAKKVKKEPCFTIHPNFHFYDIFHCPNCNNIVKEYEDGCVYPKLRNDFCNKCGQKLDWQ